MAGFAAGVVIGTRLPLMFGVQLDSDGALAIALPAALLLGAAAGAAIERHAWRIARGARGRVRIDGVGGALLAAAAATVAVWALAPVVAEVRPVRKSLERSDVLSQLNAVLEPAGPKRVEILQAVDNLPRYRGPRPDVAAGDPRILLDPDVVAAERSVLRIRVQTCNHPGGGSGWVAGDGIVATNAHVVAAATEISVQRRRTRERLRAIPIWFDGRNDIALLRVAGLADLPVLPLAGDPRSGTAGASLGFPRGRWKKRRARLGPTTSRLNGRLGGAASPGVSDKLAGRRVALIRGKTEPGSSGGPVVDEQGHVLATVFAGGGGASATLGVPNEFVRRALREAGPRVSTGRCED